MTFFFIIKLRSWTSKKENLKPYEERKFIVFEKNLLSLFASCSIRAGPAQAHQISSKLSTLWLKSTSVAADEKSCQFSQMWFSQPFVKGQMPYGNLQLSASISG